MMLGIAIGVLIPPLAVAGYTLAQVLRGRKIWARR